MSPRRQTTARSKAIDPDGQTAALQAKRVDLARRRHEATAAQGAAERVVEGAADRRHAVLLAEARGETPPETTEQIDLDRRRAEVEIANTREKAAALKQVEQEVGEEVDAVIDANPQHYIAAAEAASEATAEAIAAASQAAQAAATAWQEARAAWAIVRQSRRRRGLDTPPEVPISDFGNAVGELAKSISRPYPGGRRESWERFCADEATQKAAEARSKLSNAAAAPLAELV